MSRDAAIARAADYFDQSGQKTSPPSLNHQREQKSDPGRARAYIDTDDAAGAGTLACAASDATAKWLALHLGERIEDKSLPTILG